MRLAKQDDLHRALEKRDIKSAPHIMRFKFSNLAGFDDTTLEPKNSFLAICGGTGVGKTALLELLYAALEPRMAGVAPEKGARFASSTVDVVVAVGDEKYEVVRKLSDRPVDDSDGYEHGVELVRLETRVSFFDSFLPDSDLEVLKEGITSSLFEQEVVSIISAACRKQYERIDIFEVEIDEGQFAPLFEVALSDVAYDNRMMATGELSVFYLAWIFKTASPNAVILIEEPEAHLPPTSHAAVFSLIAREAIRKNICVVITTHSSTIAEHVPGKCLISIKSSGTKSTLPQKAESKLRVLSRLGLGPKMNACLFVEDDLGAAILNEVWGMFEFRLVCNGEIVVAKGFGDIRKAIESLPDSIRSTKFIGVLDGDMKPKTAKWKCKDALIFLPFSKAMEVELIDVLEGDTAKGAIAIGRSQQSLDEALEATRGDNHHDRFRAISAALNLSDGEFMRGALERWRKKPGKNNKFKRFALDLSKRLGIELP